LTTFAGLTACHDQKSDEIDYESDDECDVPSASVVIHVQMRHKLRDYVRQTHYHNALHREDKFTAFAPDIYQYITDTQYLKIAVRESIGNMYKAMLCAKGNNNTATGKRCPKFTYVGYPENCLPRAKVIDMRDMNFNKEHVFRVRCVTS
jgi:hypothetical protein